MENGLYFVELNQLSALRAQGVEIPVPWVGAVDVQRIMEGKLEEPPRGQPLGVAGLEDLLQAVGDDAEEVLRNFRRRLRTAGEYFAWNDVPLVFLIDGALTRPADAKSITLTVGSDTWELEPLAGHRLQPMKAGIRGWYEPIR